MSSYLELAVQIANLFERLDIPYVIGGSLASSLVGEPRSTVDIDVAISIDGDGLERLLDAVRAEFYVPEREALRAVAERDSFNLIHDELALKVDLFVLGDGLLDRNQLARRILVELPTEPPATVYITSPEDQILRKLDWYRTSQSERQWRDVVAILRTVAEQLDDAYLSTIAAAVGLGPLLVEARAAAGIG